MLQGVLTLQNRFPPFYLSAHWRIEGGNKRGVALHQIIVRIAGDPDLHKKSHPDYSEWFSILSFFVWLRASERTDVALERS